MLFVRAGPKRGTKSCSRFATHVWEADRDEAILSHEASDAVLSQPAGADVGRVRDGGLAMVKRGLVRRSWTRSRREWVAPAPLTEGNGHGLGFKQSGRPENAASVPGALIQGLAPVQQVSPSWRIIFFMPGCCRSPSVQRCK